MQDNEFLKDGEGNGRSNDIALPRRTIVRLEWPFFILRAKFLLVLIQRLGIQNGRGILL
jgi:hypothetical protein